MHKTKTRHSSYWKKPSLSLSLTKGEKGETRLKAGDAPAEGEDLRLGVTRADSKLLESGLV